MAKFQLASGVTSAEIWVGDKPIRLDSDKAYETDDPTEIRVLEAWDAVVTVRKEK